MTNEIIDTTTIVKSDEISNDEEGCNPTEAGQRRGISSLWCDQNCAMGRHPACQSSSGEHQFCSCSSKGTKRSLALIIDYVTFFIYSLIHILHISFILTSAQHLVMRLDFTLIRFIQ